MFMRREYLRRVISARPRTSRKGRTAALRRTDWAEPLNEGLTASRLVWRKLANARRLCGKPPYQRHPSIHGISTYTLPISFPPAHCPRDLARPHDVGRATEAYRGTHSAFT